MLDAYSKSGLFINNKLSLFDVISPIFNCLQSKEYIKNEFDDIGNEFKKTEKWYNNSTITKFTIFPAIILVPVLVFGEIYPHFLFLNDIHHFYFEIIAVIFDSLIVLYCFSRYAITKEKLIIFLGLGFVASASIDVLHAIVSVSLIGQTSFLGYFIPQTWAAGRIIDASMLVIAFLKFSNIMKKNEPYKEKNSWIKFTLSAIIAIVIASIVFSLFAPLPSIIIAEENALLDVIHRPYDLVAMFIFISAIFLFFKNGLHKINEILFKGLAAYMIISIFGQAIITMSHQNFDTAFNFAHILKDIAYFAIIIVLAQSFQHQFIAKMKLVKEIKQIEKQKDEFVSMITHELKTPLMPIIGWCDALKSSNMLGPTTKDQVEALDSIYLNSLKLKQMIGDVLDTQRLELKKIPIVFSEFNVNNMLEKMVFDFKTITEAKNISLLNIMSSYFSMISDSKKIEQVFAALINNAVDFVPKENGVIQINAEEEDKVIIFSVKDNGLGIPKEKQKELFQKFYQIDPSLTRRHGGTGLGLAISKGMIELLDGDIWVESSKGKGTTFKFSVPKTKN